ncbi:hypothetical protein [Paracoccus siganidrum]|uniref:DUF58 domain-containing protein n=1 Tax=Paracoccus siganidrum TaxID=1276757 RepID=A0A419A4E9_9RHOB|nr:hypothetical protein [Paracoccus siganidrum]RJL09134.1 hypothetical protein D3P05_15170 [Paracoccus siganidrum]RMC25688.1 hypothetical protein C9E82_23010 [Paracoccus siganidrum]
MSAGESELYLFDALAWRLARAQPGLREGSHRGRMRGAGEAFADIAALLAHPDPRRLDLRRSLTDPFGGFFVRRFERRTDLVLHLLLDGSASLAAGASSDRQGLAALLAGGLAQAARRGGDRFAMQAIGGEVELLSQPPSRRAGLGDEIRARITAMIPQGQGAAGLIAAAEALPQARILVALVSDFDHAPAELDALLAALSPRPVLPVWLRDTGLEEPPDRFGLVETRDPETGRRRTVLATRRWAARQVQAGRDHRDALRRVFAAHGLRAIEIADSIDMNALIAALEEAPL